MANDYYLRQIMPGYQPILCTSQHIYLFRRGWLYRTSHSLEVPVRIARIPDDRQLISFAPRIFERVFRTAVQSAALCGSNEMLLARRNNIWRIDLKSGAVELDYSVPDGRSLLTLSKITSSKTRAEWLVFGEYFHNPDRGEVRLWRRKCEKNEQWKVGATFPVGEINHVHAIQQLSDGRVYVLAGDFEDAASVWETDADLNELRPIMRGEQRFRACWWFERDSSVVYGTDSNLEVNELLTLQPNNKTLRKLAELPGSCIYHGRTGANLVFSTTVEPGHTTGNFVRDALSRTAGPGITGDPAIFLYSDSLVKLFDSPKDFWPPRLGQFGTFMFPAGVAPENRFYAYGVAVKKYDGTCLVFDKL